MAVSKGRGRGFASMSPEKKREIASKGGKAAHQKGTAHEWTSEEARDAGRKGGIASHQRRREQTSQSVERGGSAERAVAMDRSSSSSSSESMQSERGGWSSEPPMGGGDREE